DPRLIPRRVLPPQSLIVALTPLLDWRVNRALLNLRARGFDLALIEIDPLPFAEHARATYGDETWRLWLLERELIRHRFLRAGVLVGRWNAGAPLAAVVEELTSRREQAGVFDAAPARLPRSARRLWAGCPCSSRAGSHRWRERSHSPRASPRSWL